MPLLLLYGWEGARACCRALGSGPRRRRWALAALRMAVLLPAARALAAMTAIARSTGAVIVPNTPYDDWREVMGLARWVRRNTPPDAVLLGNFDPVFYLYTGRRGVRGFVPEPYRLHYDPRPQDSPLGTPSDLLRTIDRVHTEYLLCTPNLAFREGPHLARLNRELVGAHPERFRLVYQSRDARYRIYGISGSVDSPHHLSDPPNLPRPPNLLASN